MPKLAKAVRVGSDAQYGNRRKLVAHLTKRGVFRLVFGLECFGSLDRITLLNDADIAGQQLNCFASRCGAPCGVREKGNVASTVEA